MPLLERIRNMIARLYQYILMFNVYAKADDDPPDLRVHQIISTRIFLLLFCLVMAVLVGRAALTRQTITIQINDPPQSEYEDLQALYPDTLSCPCSQSTVSVGSFAAINAILHQVCSSDFVTAAWIAHLSSNYSSDLYYPLDIRISASSQFQLLAVLCSTSQEAVIDAISKFNTSKLVIPNMLSRSAFDAQVKLLVYSAYTSLLDEQQRTRILIRAINELNQLPTALWTSYIYIYFTNQYQGLFFVTYPSANNSNASCSCQYSFDCVYPAAVYRSLSGNNTQRESGHLTSSHRPDFTLQGMLVGCFPLNVLLQSTLECLFHSTCLANLQSALPTGLPLPVTALTMNEESRFPFNTTVQTIIDQLLIEQWINTSSYSVFYTECQPTYCIYSIMPKVTLVYVFSTIISLVGGLTIVLKVISSLLVKLGRRSILKIFKIKSPNTMVTENAVDDHPPIVDRMKMIIKRVYEKLLQLNLFKSRFTDEYGRRSEIITTRLFLFLLIASLIILTLYSSISEHTQTVKVSSPTNAMYRDLAVQYEDTLSCPCTQTVTSYETFISIIPVYHQLCSSIFVTSDILPTFQLQDISYQLGVFDFNFFGPAITHLLPGLCNLTQRTVTDALGVFNTTKYVSATLTSEKELIARASSSLTALKTQTPTTLQHLLQLSRDTTRGNQLLTAFFATGRIYRRTVPYGTSQSAFEIWWTSNFNPFCNCGTSPTACVIPFSVYCELTAANSGAVCYELAVQFLKGLSVGCNPIEGVLQGTLECFYDELCLFMIESAVQYYSVSLDDSSVMKNIPALNGTVQSRFLPNTSMLEIVQGLMVEQWLESVNFDSYFTQCHPTICIYTFTQRFNLATTAVTVIGILGGLSVVLRILTPVLVSIFRRKKLEQSTPSKLHGITTASVTRCVDQMQALLKRAVLWITQLNLFQSAASIDDDRIRRDEIITTRLYIFLVAVCFSAVTLFMLVTSEKVTITVDNPSLAIYEQLQIEQMSLICPCSTFSIPYETFANVSQPTLHQVCMSNLVDETWTSTIFGDTTVNRSVPRAFLSAHFQLISAICLSSKQTLADTVQIFGSNQFVTVQLLSRIDFMEQLNITLTEFFDQAPNLFRRALTFILETTLANQVMSVYESNWHVTGGLNLGVTMVPRYYGSCGCGTLNASQCLAPMVFNNGSMIVNGMFIGCLPLSSLLRSSLSCFFNDTCFLQLQTALNIPTPIPALNITSKSRFKPDTLLGNIINSLMVETWTSKVDYLAYFTQCRATTCTYSQVSQKSFAAIVAKLLGLYSGTIIAMKLTARLLIKIYRKIISSILRRWSRRVEDQ